MSLNATLATGILLCKGGESYRTQALTRWASSPVQQWYGDTARWAGDPTAAHAPVEYSEVRHSDDGDVAVPVPVAPKPADYDQHATQDTHFISFDVFAGGTAELEYLRHIGVLDEKFGPVGPQALNLTQYLQQAAQPAANAQVAVSVQGPQTVLTGGNTSYVPADYALPYTVSFSNPTEHPVGELRIVRCRPRPAQPALERPEDRRHQHPCAGRSGGLPGRLQFHRQQRLRAACERRH
ncbi:MAG: hypothetical protein JF606_03175 [Burkholderiales bacterium]|nr:hypothetical protein [Burkholderiales bacterium]